MKLKELQEAVYAQEVECGLYKKKKSVHNLLWHIREEGNEAIRAWNQYKDLNVHYECESRFKEDCLKVEFDCSKCDKRINDGVSQELADVIIKTLSACEQLGIDIEAAIKEKMEYNAIRKRCE